MLAWHSAPGTRAIGHGGLVAAPRPGAQRERWQRALQSAAALGRRAGRRSLEGSFVSDDSIRATVERARAGDPDAFAELFTRFDPEVFRVCRRMLGGGPAAQDARSEVFLRARRALHTYDTSRPFRPWLLSIAGHHCIDQLRHRAAERRVFADVEIEQADLHAPGPSPLSRLLAAEERLALDAAIESLPLQYRLPLLLRYFGDYDYAAIAEALGVTRNQVGTLLFRAKRKLREQIGKGVGASELAGDEPAARRKRDR